MKTTIKKTVNGINVTTFENAAGYFVMIDDEFHSFKTIKAAVEFIQTITQPETLTDRQLDNRMKKLADLDAQIKALQDARDALKDEITAAMTGDALDLPSFTVKWTDVTSKRFDSKAFKADHPETYDEYSKETTTKRFTYKAK